MIHKILHRFLKYSAVNAVLFLLNLGLIIFLTEKIGLHYIFSTSIGLLIACTGNYFLGLHWVFPDSHAHKHKSKGYMRALAVASGIFVIIISSTYLLVSYAAMSYILARMLVAVFGGIGGYIADSSFTHKLRWHGLPKIK